MNLYHYYHVYADGDWERIVDEHLDALRSSGLYDELESFNVGIVGNWHNRDDVIYHMERDWGLSFKVVAEVDEGWEQITINAALDMVRPWFANGLVLYAHTKGAAFPGEHPDHWRRVMTYELVDQWRSVVEKMTQGHYDTAGCYLIKEKLYEPEVPVFAGVHGHSTVASQLLELSGGAGIFDTDPELLDEPQPARERLHYSGNFWWSTMSWLRRLHNPVEATTRWDAEMAVGQSMFGSLMNGLDVHPGSPFDELRRGVIGT